MYLFLILVHSVPLYSQKIFEVTKLLLLDRTDRTLGTFIVCNC